MWICLSSSETSRPKPVAVISGAAAAVRPPLPRDEAERRERAADQAVHDVGALDRRVAAKMIGTSAPNSAATASVHIATQNPALRRGAVKRLGGRLPVSRLSAMPEGAL